MKSEFIKKEGYKVLYTLDVPYQAEKIVKENNSITGYVNNKPIWQFPNISNMADFVLEDGETFDNHEEEKRLLDLEMAIVDILGGGF